MTTTTTRRVGSKRFVAGLLSLLGVGLAGYGLYTHLSVAAAVRAGNCDGCAPWHPLLVVAPLAVGILAVLAGVYLIARR